LKATFLSSLSSSPQDCPIFYYHYSFHHFPLIFFVERDEFIRYFLAKGLQEQEGYTPYKSAKSASEDIEEVYGVSFPNFSSSSLLKSDYEINPKRGLTIKSMRARSSD
jgi:hypothetical protein